MIFTLNQNLILNLDFQVVFNHHQIVAFGNIKINSQAHILFNCGVKPPHGTN